MQQIERYGVMVLLLMFVTILVVAMWDGEAPARAGADKPGAATTRVASKDSARKAPTRGTSTRPRQAATRPRETRSVPIGSVASNGSSASRRSSQSGRTSASSRGSRSSSGSQRSRRASRPEPARTELRTVGTSSPSTGTLQARGTRSTSPTTAGSSPALATPRMAGGTPSTARERSTTPAPAPERRSSPSINSVATRETSRPASRETRSSQPSTRKSGWTYEIKPGDTLQAIASRVLGDGARWKEIQAANDGLDPRRLMVGARIQLPGAPERVATTGAPAVTSNVRPAVARPAVQRAASGGATYVIRKGDVLSRVAQEQLGSASRWREIVELNPGLDPKRLHVGTELVLPAGARRTNDEPTAVAVADTRSAATDERRFRVR